MDDHAFRLPRDDHALALLRQIAEAERELRAQAEANYRQLQEALVLLLNGIAGEHLEELRRTRPNLALTPTEWQTVVRDVLRQRQHARPLAACNPRGWLNETARALELERENADLHIQIGRLKTELAALQAEVERLRRQGSRALPREAAVAHSLAAPKSKAKPAPVATAPPAKDTSAPEEDGWLDAGRLLDALRSWAVPRVPSRYRSVIPRTKWRRQSKMLYLISRGLNIRLEILTLVGQSEDVSGGSGSLRRAFAELAQKHLIEMSKLTASETTLVVARLTEDGRRLCALLDWPVRESEWERLVRLHAAGEGQETAQEPHTLAVLSFAMNARRRGYAVQVMPPVDGPAAPDVLLVRDAERLYVEVERSRKEHTNKWRGVAALNGGLVALCATSPQARAQHVRDCMVLKLHGVATDLQSLFQQEKHGEVGELWIERF